MSAWSVLQNLHINCRICWKTARRVQDSVCRRPILSGLLCLFFILGLGPVYDEFRIWASNLVRFYFIESLSRFELVIYFVLISYYLSVNVMFVFVPYRVLFLYIFTLKVVLFMWLCFVINCVFINHVVFVSFLYCVSYFNFTLCLLMTCLSKISFVF